MGEAPPRVFWFLNNCYVKKVNLEVKSFFEFNSFLKFIKREVLTLCCTNKLFKAFLLFPLLLGAVRPRAVCDAQGNADQDRGLGRGLNNSKTTIRHQKARSHLSVTAKSLQYTGALQGKHNNLGADIESIIDWRDSIALISLFALR